MQHITDGQLYRPDPLAPRRKWLLPSLAEADTVVIYDQKPNVSQPFRLVNETKPAYFVPGDTYWLRGVAEDGERAWRVQLVAARPAGRDIVLDLNVIP